MEKEYLNESSILYPSDYPEQLRQIPDMPEKLWLRGTMPPEAFRLLAVVGSRALSRYGRDMCRSLIAGLSGYPVSIVSGLAIGADACAHQNALEAGLHTIAIPGSGLADSVLYPRQNRFLAQQILAHGGTLLSEHEPQYKPHPFDFPSRNRIMAGLSHAVLIIEAGKKSGTLITARLAVDYSRDVLCVPHRISDPHSFGASHYLREGAAYVRDSLDILEALGISPRSDDPLLVQSAASTGASARHDKAIQNLSNEERKLYGLLEAPRSRDWVIRESSLPAQKILVLLVTLELKGFIQEKHGEWMRLL